MGRHWAFSAGFRSNVNSEDEFFFFCRPLSEADVWVFTSCLRISESFHWTLSHNTPLKCAKNHSGIIRQGPPGYPHPPLLGRLRLGSAWKYRRFFMTSAGPSATPGERPPNLTSTPPPVAEGQPGSINSSPRRGWAKGIPLFVPPARSAIGQHPPLGRRPNK